MQAKALVCTQDQQFSIREVTVDPPKPNQVLVRTAYSGVSIGTEFALISGKLSWGPYPLCTGYMATGVVEAVGSDVHGMAVGDRVYTRGHRGPPARLANGTPVSPVSGAHCSYMAAEPYADHGMAPLPQGVPMDLASTFVMPAVGLHGVDIANPRMGDLVAVHGTGLIGLGVVAACAHRGCQVIAIDLDADRLAVAEALGADHVIDGSVRDVPEAVRAIAPGGADVVFEATGIPACIDQAIPLCRPFGKFVWQGNYGSEPVSFHFLPAHERRLQMFFPCDDGMAPCRRAVLKNMASGALDWERTITHRIDYEQAPAMYERINRGEADDVLGVIIRWEEGA